MLASVLWELPGECQVQSLGNDGTAGHEFEDLTVEKVYASCLKLGTLRPFPPRYKLKLPTVSGSYHQIDVVVRDGSSGYHLVECKFKQSTDVAELYAFNGKLLDYIFGAKARNQKVRFRGYFLTTSPSVSEGFCKYALAWGITLVAPNASDCPPPPEYMLSRTKPDTALQRRLNRLVERTVDISLAEIATGPREAGKLVADWRVCFQHWRKETNGI